MRSNHLTALVVIALVSPALSLAAQRNNRDSDDARWLDECRNGWNGNNERGRACEVRAVPLHLSGRALDIDGRENGGIHVDVEPSTSTDARMAAFTSMVGTAIRCA